MSMMTSVISLNNFKTFLLLKKSGIICLLANCQGYLISKIKICLLNLKAIPVSLNQTAVIKNGVSSVVFCCINVSALMFPTYGPIVYRLQRNIQMLKQDVFFTLKWQADCQLLQLVILCKGRKRSLIITIYYV